MMFNNPFKPREVKMSNYHPESIEQNKLHDMQEKTQAANGQVNEFQKGYHAKTYSDAIEKPKSYGEVIGRPKSYGDFFHRPKSYSEAQSRNESTINNSKIETSSEHVINTNIVRKFFGGNKNN